MNAHILLAMKMGAPPEAAYAMASLYPARHAHMDSIVGSITPGRYADVVLLSSVKDVTIKEVFANGLLATKDGKYLLPVPKIKWPPWATDTIHVGRKLANILAGGPLTSPQFVSEQYVLDLEREAFVSLCGEKKTQERIAHTLKTGKPLRN